MNEILDKNYYWYTLKVYCDLGDGIRTVVTVGRKDRDEDIRTLKATRKLFRMEKYKNTYWYNVTEDERRIEYDDTIIESESLEDIFNKIQPQYKNTYLQNGKLKGGIRNNE